MPKIMRRELTENAVFSIYLQGIGYTVAQLRDDNRMEVFDIIKNKDEWSTVNLNNEKVLFCIVVAAHRLLRLFYRCITYELVHNTRDRGLLGLSLSSVRDVTGIFGLSLIKHGEVFEPSSVDVLIRDLDPERHRDILYSFELMSMNGSVDKIMSRLVRFFTLGVNFDDQIKVLYPEIDLPPAGYKRVQTLAG